MMNFPYRVNADGLVVVDYFGKFIGTFNPESKVFVSGKRFFNEHIFHKVHPFSLGCSYDVLMVLRRWECVQMKFFIVRDDKFDERVGNKFPEECWITTVNIFLNFGKVWFDGLDSQRVLHCSLFDRFLSDGSFVKSSLDEFNKQKVLVDVEDVVKEVKVLKKGGLSIVHGNRLKNNKVELSRSMLKIKDRLRKAKFLSLRKIEEDRKDLSSKQVRIQRFVS